MTYLDDRKTVGQIIRQVRLGTLCVREALLQFPKDNEDKSIQACYHALVHYEADENLRLRDSLYKEEQDDYIEFLSDKMIAGDDLPQNIKMAEKLGMNTILFQNFHFLLYCLVL